MWLRKLNEWKNAGLPCAIVTIIEATGSTPRGVGSKMAVNAKGDIAGSVGGGGVEHKCRAAAQAAIAGNGCLTKKYSLLENDLVLEGDQKALGVCGGTVTVFIEPIMPRPEVVVFGAGHIGENIGKLCGVLGIPHRVYDERTDYVTTERFPGAWERIAAPYGELRQRIKLSKQSYCVVLTHGHLHDQECLEQLLLNPGLPYIGMIGSRTKVAVLFNQVQAKGLKVDQRVYSPVGIKLSSQLPEEIAFSIIAEIMLLINNGELAHHRLPIGSQGWQAQTVES